MCPRWTSLALANLTESQCISVASVTRHEDCQHCTCCCILDNSIMSFMSVLGHADANEEFAHHACVHLGDVAVCVSKQAYA